MADKLVKRLGGNTGETSGTSGTVSGSGGAGALGAAPRRRWYTMRIYRSVLTAGIVAATAGLALVVGAPFVGGTASATATAQRQANGSNISIVQTPSLSFGPCIGPGQLSRNVVSDNSVFRLSIVAPGNPCEPIRATAAIYAMPGGGVAWPQKLRETKDFTISVAGTTEITFDKDCTPVQFDVVTGPTPDVINPLGEMHGPLLFPLDIGTSFQDPGIVCEEATTTAAPSTSAAPASTSATTTTVIAPVVSGVSTSQAPIVGGVSRSNDPRSTGGAALAATGSTSQTAAFTGVAMFMAGVAMILASRRRILPNVRLITSESSVSDDSPFGLS